jgi:hypothetical protein
MKTDFFNKITRLANKGMFKIKKHSPEILLVAGITGTVATTVIACKKTLKINDILDENKEIVDSIHNELDKHDEEKYSQKDANKDLAIAYTQTGVKLFKLYLPAIGLGTLSISMLIGGHHILSKRNATIVAAYAALDRSFKKYRENVIDVYGQGVDQALRFNIKALKEDPENKKDDKKKTEEETKEIQITDDYNKESIYARFFDVGNKDWTKDPEYNLLFLRKQQAYANELLRTKGHLFLNEVYDMLDIPRTKAGQLVGWLYYKDGENPDGDNYVDFGIYDAKDQQKKAFVNGLERSILLDFNVDGVIYDKI